ncbi:MAG: thioredoxin family protein [Deltaproteobacteria bacterium]|nr:thioredoxin family protein [Deltaproteobacteria bacterium]
MKTFKLTGILAAFLFSHSLLALQMGDSLPTINQSLMNPVTGKSVLLSKSTGSKGTLVIFTCNHCPYVKAWQDRLVAIGNEYSAKGIGVIAINSNDDKAYKDDSPEVMKAVVKRTKMKFPYVVDTTSDVARAFGASKTPETFLFDAKGKLVFTGAIDDNAQDASAVKKTYLKNALDEVLAGKSVTTSEAQTMGCGIKFREKKS